MESPMLKSFLAGSLSGTCSTILFQPLDVVKTRLQTAQCATITRPNNIGSFGMVNILSGIFQKDQLFGLWKGMSPSLTRCVPGVGLYFASMHWMKDNLISGEPTPLESLAIGIAGRSISGICLIPITVVKTRFESGEYPYKGVTQALRVIYKSEGIRGLSCGLIPTLFRDAPFSGLYLMFYSQIKRSLPQDSYRGDMAAPAHFCCGVVAGMLASLVTQPADVIKTKMQLYPGRFHSIFHVVLYIQEKYGVKGYFKGLMPRTLRRTLVAAMSWTIYEQLTRSIGLK
uniref:Mitochondrial glycine transporter n=1 Tax=Clastoptera arizonana TaxID=38151 RepID=A0A1B6DWZ3_9HEMI